MKEFLVSVFEWTLARLGLFDRYRAWYIIHRAKTEWVFTGFQTLPNGFRVDAGTFRSDEPMRLKDAKAFLTARKPGAAIIEISHRSKLIIYSI